MTDRADRQQGDIFVTDGEGSSKIEEIAELVRRVCIADGNVAIYGLNHPLCRQSVSAAYEWLTRMIDARDDTVRLHVSENKLVFEGFPLETRNAQVARLVGRLGKLHVHTLEFRPGIGDEEYAAFHELLSMKEEDIEAQGGVKALLDLAGIDRIAVSGAAYVLVEEDERVIGDGAAVTEDLGVDAAAKQRIIEYMLQHVMKEADEKDWLLTCMKNNPREMAVVISEGIERAFSENDSAKQQEETIQSLVENIRTVGRNLMDEDTGQMKDGQESIKDSLLELEKEIQSRAQQLMSSRESQRFVNELLRVVAAYTDEVKTKRLSREFLKSEHGLKTTERLLKKLTGKGETGEELLLRLKREMLRAGVKEEDLHELLQKVRKKKRTRRKKSFDQALHDGVVQRVKQLGIEDEDNSEAVLSLITFFENKLKEKEKLFRDERTKLALSVARRDRILDEIADTPIVIWDTEGVVDYLNDAARDRLGFETGTALDKRALALMKHPSFPGNLADEINDDNWSAESRRILASITAIIREADGTAVGAVVGAERSTEDDE